MANAVLTGLGKRYQGGAVLDDFSLEIADGELVTVLGPSGCGKSTLLRLIAGLDEPTAGSIHLDGRRIDALPPQERDVAMVFQSYALYPHLSVGDNIDFPLRMRGVAAVERRERVAEVAALVELEGLLDRMPAELSGGQRQRVALARALVRRPALFLLDEPLSNLDARLRASVRRSIRDLQRRLAVTTLYVTHDQVEAMTLGERVVVLDRGRIQQCDAPLAVYERPANAFVAGFVGSPPMNLLAATLDAGVLRIGEQRLELDGELRQRSGDITGAVLVGIRAESFGALHDGVTADVRHLVGEVEHGSRELLGSETLLRATVAGTSVAVRTFGSLEVLPARVAAPVARMHLFTADGRRIAP